MEDFRNGISIEKVYGTGKTGAFLLCVSKSLIMFLICAGTVTGFCDAFMLDYSRPVLVLYTLIASLVLGFFLYKKNSIFFGIPVIALVFILLFKKYCIYVTYGLDQIWNAIQDFYGKYLKMEFEEYEYVIKDDIDMKKALNITLAFIITMLLVLYCITIVRYMNLAETFVISFIILLVPLYIGRKPELISIIMIMAGFICIFLLHYGTFNNIDIPLLASCGYTDGKKSGKKVYTTVGSCLGVLMILSFSVIISLLIGMIGRSGYTKDMEAIPIESTKDKMDIMVREVSRYGIDALFETHATRGGIKNGVLGDVSIAEHGLGTDLVVSFVPYSADTVYLPGFKGIQYTGRTWESSVNTENFSNYALKYFGSIDSDTLDIIDRSILGMSMNKNESKEAKMQISYVAPGTNAVLPYYTFPIDVGWPEEQFYQPGAGEDDRSQYSFDTREVTYYPLDYIKYESEDSFYQMYGAYGYSRSILSFSWQVPGTDSSLYYYDYINDICTEVPAGLSEYLEGFIRDHGYFGLDKEKIDKYYKGRNNSYNTYYNGFNGYYGVVYDYSYPYPLERNYYNGYSDDYYSDDYYSDDYYSDDYYTNDYYTNDYDDPDEYYNDSNDVDTPYFYYDQDQGYYYIIYRKGDSDGYGVTMIPFTYSSDIQDDISVIEENNTTVKGSAGLDPLDGRASSDIYDIWYKPYSSLTNEKKRISDSLAEMEKENEFRLEACAAIRDMFQKEYAYTLSPGKTPLDVDYVKYFLSQQKRGLCTHFASAAVMLLRQMGIPARYREGYCIPGSLMQKSGVELDVDSTGWFEGENKYNPENKIYSVEVSDYYAHAWIEVFLENKGFVPFEVTPVVYTNERPAPQMPDISKYIPKAKDNTVSGNSKPSSTPTPKLTSTPTPSPTPSPTPTPAVTSPADKDEKNSDKDKGPEEKDSSDKKENDSETKKSENNIWTLLKPLVIVAGVILSVLILILIIMLLINGLSDVFYLSRGRFRRLIYMRYCKLVKKLKKKKIIESDNPLPMELCLMLSEYTAEKVRKQSKEAEHSDSAYDMVYTRYQKVFQYIEKVLYSSYETNEAEYKDLTGRFWRHPILV